MDAGIQKKVHHITLTRILGRISLIAIIFVTLQFNPFVYAADLKSSEIPSAQSSTNFMIPDTATTIILRDAGLGLGVGTVTGVLFSLMTGGKFSQPTNMIRSDAFGTGLFTGLIGGIATGIWQVKKRNSNKISITPTISASDGASSAISPSSGPSGAPTTTMGTQITF